MRAKCNQCGSGRQLCCKCLHKSVAGFIKGHGHCPHHWALLQGWNVLPRTEAEKKCSNAAV
jgi:hypothetical protein